MTDFKRLAVYCGSATPADPLYMALAKEVGTEFARRGITVVYGGGKVGLMGMIADSALAAGGEVIGVIPEALVGAEVAHRGLTELHVVPDMHARKALFTSLSDGFVTLPGGVGTKDELWEAGRWAQVGYHSKPVGLLNTGGFYDQLIAFNRHMIDVGFIRPAHPGILFARHPLGHLLEAMAAYEPHETIFSMKVSRL